jgi:hypothetical protein
MKTGISALLIGLIFRHTATLRIGGFDALNGFNHYGYRASDRGFCRSADR